MTSNGHKKERARLNRKDFFTPEQFQIFIDACPRWLASFARFASLTAMRPGEIRELRRSAVILKANIIHDGQEFGLINLSAAETKSGRDETILLLPAAREILQGLHASINHPGLFFLGHKARPITKGSLRHYFEAARRKSGLEVARPHMLRHTAVSWLIQRGVPLAFVQQIVRHRNYQTTLGYTHFLPQHLAGAMTALVRSA